MCYYVVSGNELQVLETIESEHKATPPLLHDAAGFTDPAAYPETAQVTVHRAVTTNSDIIVPDPSASASTEDPTPCRQSTFYVPPKPVTDPGKSQSASSSRCLLTHASLSRLHDNNWLNDEVCNKNDPMCLHVELFVVYTSPGVVCCAGCEFYHPSSLESP